MSVAMFLFPLAGLSSLIAAYLLWTKPLTLPQLVTNPQPLIKVAVIISILLTIIATIATTPTGAQGIRFTIIASAGSATILIQLIYLIGLLRHGIYGLGLVLLPATGLPLLFIPMIPTGHEGSWLEPNSILGASHLVISMGAYAVITLSALHALMYLIINRALKAKRIHPITQAMPALLDIETHMFAQVRGTLWLLSLSILTGLSWQWIEMSHFSLLSHKVMLSIIAWVLLLVLELGHQHRVWRQKVSSYMVLVAYTLMLLAYFGSRFIMTEIHG
ncbi:MAG: cytochrome c biogenesis protein CcsA [Mariprofundales bacterium]|nr:cytochrome c biogenesis protein CcsA [Mariprofundales bacterium]